MQLQTDFCHTTKSIFSTIAKKRCQKFFYDADDAYSAYSDYSTQMITDHLSNAE